MKTPRKLFGGFGNRLFQMAYIYADMRRGRIPDIYVQNLEYFEEFGDEIKRWFGEGVKPLPYVSLHVRRGDYLNNHYYAQLEADYYQKAMAEFPGARFLIFCADRQEGSNDVADIQWCKDTFKGEQFEFWIGKSEEDDFNAMAGCEGHIIANSSFSWMAAYVGGGKTVAPKAWFANGTTIPTPNDWILI